MIRELPQKTRQSFKETKLEGPQLHQTAPNLMTFNEDYSHNGDMLKKKIGFILIKSNPD